MQVIFRCTSCATILATEFYPGAKMSCVECGTLVAVPSESEIVDVDDLMEGPATEVASERIANRFASRYRDGYRAAWAINTCGAVLKVLGVVSAVVIAAAGSANRSSFGGESLLSVSLVSAIFIGVLLFVAGIFFSAQGQMMRAMLDATINANPFMTDTEKLTAMGL